LAKIQRGDASWMDMVPPQVADVICKNGYLGWKKS
jgi:hypothetical protein